MRDLYDPDAMKASKAVSDALGQAKGSCFATCRPGPWPARDRDQPVTDTTASRIRPLSFLLAFTYAFAYLVVTSARDCIDNSLLIPHHAHRFAGIPT